MMFCFIKDNEVVAKANWDNPDLWQMPRNGFQSQARNTVDEIVFDDSLQVGWRKQGNNWQSHEVDKLTFDHCELKEEFVNDHGIGDAVNFCFDYISLMRVVKNWSSGISLTTGEFVFWHDSEANERRMYKVIQGHTTQSDWLPKDEQALFAQVPMPFEIPLWNFYFVDTIHLVIQVGQKVSWAGDIWECINPTFAWIEPGTQDSHFAWNKI